MMFRRIVPMRMLLLSAVLLTSVLHARDEASQELSYPSKEFSRLDTFEAVALEDADKLFSKRDYRGAFAAYKGYTFEFAKGKALPYVLFRMGRCLHLLGKRNTAVKAYQDVVDYFPNEVRYAAAALYYIGQCHAQNGNEDKSLAAWARLAKDKDYANQPRSGTALAALAVAMDKRGKFEEATSYRWRTAVAFRKSNVRASQTARDSVIFHYAVRSPNQDKLLAFCREVGGFGWHQPIKKPEESTAYWGHILSVVQKAKVKDEQKSRASQYWSGRIGDRFKSEDKFRVSLFNTQLIHEKDRQKWQQRIEAQFKSKSVSMDRVIEWLGHYRDGKQRSAFYKAHGQPLLAGLSNDQRIKLMKRLRHPLRMNTEALSVLRSVRLDGMNDKAIYDLAMFAADFENEEGVLRYLGKIKNSTFAAKGRFDYYYRRAHRNGDFQEKALAEVVVLRKSPDYAQSVVWDHAQLLQWQGRMDDAIKQYKAANRQPDSTWRIIDCHLAMKRYSQAIRLAGELESLGGGVAAQASLKAADIYKISGQKGKEVQQLRVILRRYPKSKQSSTAHGRLESYGVKLVGGESEAEE